MAIKDIAGKLGRAIGNNSPHILSALGVVSFVSAVVMTAKAAPKAAPAWEDIRNEYDSKVAHGEDSLDALVDAAERTAKEVAPLYLGAGGMVVLGTACVIAADRIHVKRQTTILAAYALSEKALDIYQEKVVERLGQSKHEKVLDAVAEDGTPFGELDGIRVDILDPEGVLVYDKVTGRYFKSSIEAVRAAEGAVSKKLIDETALPLSAFYEELGIPDLSDLGDFLGWDIGRCKLDIHFTSMLDPHGVPCMVLNYRTCIVNGYGFRY